MNGNTNGGEEVMMNAIAVVLENLDDLSHSSDSRVIMVSSFFLESESIGRHLSSKTRECFLICNRLTSESLYVLHHFLSCFFNRRPVDLHIVDNVRWSYYS
jgi:hypothetical protein